MLRRWGGCGWISSLQADIHVFMFFFFCGNKAVKQQSYQITAALRGVLTPVIQSSNFRCDGGVVLMIIVVSLSIFHYFFLEIRLKNRLMSTLDFSVTFLDISDWQNE
jgi:hypothetical protein